MSCLVVKIFDCFDQTQLAVVTECANTLLNASCNLINDEIQVTTANTWNLSIQTNCTNTQHTVNCSLVNTKPSIAVSVVDMFKR